jgi:hypothetical protein
MASLLSKLRSPRAKKIISIMLLVYLIGALLIYFFQETLIFRSRALPASHQFDSSLPHREITVAVNKQDTLHAVLYPIAVQSEAWFSIFMAIVKT